MAKFDKDAWILEAIACRYIIAREDGTVWRRKYASADYKRMSAEVYQIKQRTHKATGRVYFNMTFKGVTKSVLVNRVIALAFLPNPLNLPQVNHIDGDKSHNYLRQPTPELIAQYGEFQLEWSTGRDNEKHAHANGLKTGRGSQNSNAKLTAIQVGEIRASTASPSAIAKAYGVARSTIVNILEGKTWIHV
ncbi:HNH endonuclease protein [Rhizobium phage RHph_N1_15]|nr:HNH endonuclease protein [Rhizobium phage RHph_N1_10]QIG69326.1 HNH endonuclease protein [Rhizobium phage RHph_N1_15]QIG75186.1 HNH endonuclease protein [Rhizobium phage RHph_N2_6]